MKPTPKPKTKSSDKYHHLSHAERDEISVYHSRGLTLAFIASCIGRDTSTISRELQRNASPVFHTCYRPNQAQLRSSLRWMKTHQRKRIPNEFMRTYIERQLLIGWTPEIISGRASLDFPDLAVSHETIYQYIYAEKRELIKTLPFAHRIRRKRGSARGKRASKIPNRVMIDERPAVVEKRKRLGDWEGDTMVSKASTSTLVVAAERTCRLVKIRKTPSRKSALVCKAMSTNISEVPELIRETLTLDNGLEFTDHHQIKKATGLDIYFCRPYHSWEKGTVEQINGLIRRFLPKGTDFAKVSKWELKRIESLLNNRPRKCLGYLTPNEFVALAA